MRKKRKLKKKKQLSVLPKLIIMLTLILALGTIFGLIGYLINKSYERSYYTALYETTYESESQLSDTEQVAGQKTADRQIYKNAKYGFGFTYPQDWRLSRDLFSESFVMVLSKTRDIPANNPIITIRVLSGSEHADLDKNTGKTNPVNGANMGIYEYSDSYEMNFSRKLTDQEDPKDNEYIQFYYQELDENGNKISRDEWKHFDSMNEIASSFLFVE